MNKLVFHWQLLLKITTQVHIWISSHQQAILLGMLEDDKASMVSPCCHASLGKRQWEGRCFFKPRFYQKFSYFQHLLWKPVAIWQTASTSIWNLHFTPGLVSSYFCPNRFLNPSYPTFKPHFLQNLFRVSQTQSGRFSGSFTAHIRCFPSPFFTFLKQHAAQEKKQSNAYLHVCASMYVCVCVCACMQTDIHMEVYLSTWAHCSHWMSVFGPLDLKEEKYMAI